MDLEDLFTGKHSHKHRNKHENDNARGRHEWGDHRDHGDDSDDDDHSHRHAPTYHEWERRTGRHRHTGHDSDDGFGGLARLLAGTRHFKWIVAAVAIGSVFLLLFAAVLLATLLPAISNSLGIAAEKGIQSAVESAVPQNGIRGLLDSAAAFLKTLWTGTGA